MSTDGIVTDAANSFPPRYARSSPSQPARRPRCPFPSACPFPRLYLSVCAMLLQYLPRPSRLAMQPVPLPLVPPLQESFAPSRSAHFALSLVVWLSCQAFTTHVARPAILVHVPLALRPSRPLSRAHGQHAACARNTPVATGSNALLSVRGDAVEVTSGRPGGWVLARCEAKAGASTVSQDKGPLPRL